MYIATRALGMGPSTIPAGVSSNAAAISVFNSWYGLFPIGQVNLNLPGSNRLNGQPFTIRLEGNVSFGAGTYQAAEKLRNFVTRRLVVRLIEHARNRSAAGICF